MDSRFDPGEGRRVDIAAIFGLKPRPPLQSDWDRHVALQGRADRLQEGRPVAKMNAIEEATFAHAVRFVDGTMTALASAARYDLDKGALALTGSEPGALAPRVVNEQISVDNSSGSMGTARSGKYTLVPRNRASSSMGDPGRT